MGKSQIRLVSVSGGKDSTATLLLAMERHPHDEIRAAFADTGNEHESTYEYVDYLEQVTGIKIHRVKADFSDRWQRRIEYVRDKWPEKGVPFEIVQQALVVLERGPTGIPFLDLCILKGRFPSRMAQFCTPELKVFPITEYTLDLIDEFGAVESWQGVRAEESPNRAKLPEREDKGGGLTIYRPIHKWTVADVFAIHKKHGIEPNPLYMQGMNRVGCMPCVNCAKGELLEISKRFPEHIERIAEWEQAVARASRRRATTFFHKGPVESPGDMTPTDIMAAGNIKRMVEWSQTLRGGKKIDLFAIFEEPSACSSAYGLCE
jgi:3'-phosphoadenosine 5'-phosphosulfate sulfotransferase (PAPS reductase)/FAD synthetase